MMSFIAFYINCETPCPWAWVQVQGLGKYQTVKKKLRIKSYKILLYTRIYKRKNKYMVMMFTKPSTLIVKSMAPGSGVQDTRWEGQYSVNAYTVKSFLYSHTSV